jgi:hypothetical protein
MRKRSVGITIAMAALAIAAACAKATQTPDCTNGQSACGDACVDMSRDTLNCGKCNNACPGAQACVSGTCTAVCPSGKDVMCGADAGKPTCVNTQSDNENCGSCGHQCAIGQVCAGGNCVDGCSSPETKCSPDGGAAYCANLKTDQQNCGACGKGCGVLETCIAGTCTGACTSGQTLCGGDGGGQAYCANLTSDNANCGACGTACTGTFVSCFDGGCSSECASFQKLCTPTDGGAPYCADTQSDNLNCGTCGKVCTNNTTCYSGICVTGGCTLTGSGTAGSPYKTAVPEANCKNYFQKCVGAKDGVWTTHPSSTDIGVYCDMTDGGVTYEMFGMGQYSKTYTGFTWIGATDFSSSGQLDAAFAYLFTRDGGLHNIDSGFTSSNCCFINTNSSNYFGLASATYMYPGSGSTFSCNPSGGYTASIYPLYLVSSSTTISSITSTQAGSVGTYASCSVSGNPAIFVKKY